MLQLRLVTVLFYLFIVYPLFFVYSNFVDLRISMHISGMYSVCGKKRLCVFGISLASVRIYLRCLTSRFRRLCRKWTYKSYPTYLHFVSTLPCDICIFIFETENCHKNSCSV